MNPTLEAYVHLIRARWRWVAWGAVLALAATAAVLLVSPPLYRTEATVFVRTPGDVSQAVDGGDLYAQSRAETYVALARSRGIATRVVADLGLNLSPEKFTRRVWARHIGHTALFVVRVGAPSAAESRRIAEVLLNELASDVNTLEAVPGVLVPRAELVVVDPPARATRIVAWGAPLYLVALGAVFLGAALGALCATIRSMASSADSGSAHGRHYRSAAAPSSNEPEGL